MSRRAVRLVLLLLACACAAPATAHAGQRALFQVGAAVRSVHPNEPVGPAGSTAGQVALTTNVHDPLQTRAVFVSNGTRSVVFVATDIFGQFAAVAQGPDLGLQGIREAAARRVSEELGVPLRAQDILISSSHSHATASVQGYWEPPPLAYMALLRDRQIEAVVAAVKAARPAHLEFATTDGAALNALTVAQVNAYEGWIPDGLVSVLRATDAVTEATIATYATIPSHPTLIPGVALHPQLLTADYPGAVRAELDRLLGGVSIVAPGTLGRQTTPWGVVDEGLAVAVRQLDWFSMVAARQIVAALGDARPLRDDRIATAESRPETTVTNGVVLALTGAKHLGSDLYGTIDAGKAPWPLTRADTSPWQDGPRLWTPLTAIRLGNVLYLSQPGEPFAEIRLSLREAIRDADEVITVSQAQDALGYYFPPSAAVVIPAYAPNDHALFNVSPTFGDTVVAGDVDLARSLGFATMEPPSSLLPPPHAYERAATSGIQALASPPVGSACGGTFAPALQAVYSPVLHQAHVAGGPKPQGDRVHWDFGDGTTVESGYLYKPARGVLATRAGGEPLVHHGYAPGRWTATVTARDELGGRASWSVHVVVHPELRADPVARRRGRLLRLTVRPRGGQATVLRTTWTLPGGSRVDAASIDVRPAGRGQYAVEVADASGAVARTLFSIRRSKVTTRGRTCSADRGQDVAVAEGSPRRRG